LFVNVDARQGELHAELVDPAGNIVARSAIVQGDQPRQELAWEQGQLSSLAGRPATVRFRLRNARLFSYWFEM
ncbi:MAG TPA: hypothetical protein VL475_00055, partial [Planctomycetaceae bacterium]|nr:hypothetical protein [Planctomycetaceae bacterium]